MELIPAPSQTLRHYSTWLLIAAGVFDIAVVAISALTDLHVISVETLGIINIGLAAATQTAKMINQKLQLTTAEKVAVIADAAAQPMKAGQADVDVKVVQAPAPKIGATSVRAYIDTAMDQRFSAYDQRLEEMSRLIERQGQPQPEATP